MGVTIEADIIKQKLPECNGGYQAVAQATGKRYGRTDDLVYSDLSSDHPIDLTRYQVLNCYPGRSGLINSGGSSGDSDRFLLTEFKRIGKGGNSCFLSFKNNYRNNFIDHRVGNSFSHSFKKLGVRHGGGKFFDCTYLMNVVGIIIFDGNNCFGIVIDYVLALLGDRVLILD